MKFPSELLQMKFPSYISCIFLLSVFSFYCYRNVFLQSEIGFKLPPVNLVSALNNFNAFILVPSTERFDLYINLQKTFDAYRENYMEHYQDYTILLNSYLILGESQIALKYYALKHYIKDGYKSQDDFVLGSPVVEFNQNFNSPVELSKNREHNLINQHYYQFGVQDNKKSCENFFNNYIYPLYKSQGSLEEIKVAKAMSNILNNWTLVKRLQIACFLGSIGLLVITLGTFFTAEINPDFLIKNKWGKYGLPIFYGLVYVTILILTFVCFCITLSTYHSKANFKGLHNTSFNVLQILLLLFVGYLSISWIIKFKREKDLENDIYQSEDNSLKRELNLLLKTGENLTPRKHSSSLLSELEAQHPNTFITGTNNNVGTENATANTTSKISNMWIILNSGISAVKPLVASLKRLITPSNKQTGVTTATPLEKVEEEGNVDTQDNQGKNENVNGCFIDDENGPTFEDIQRIIRFTNNPSNLTTSVANLATTDKLYPIGEENCEGLSVSQNLQQTVDNFPAINIVSAISGSHPDCSPFTKSNTSLSSDLKLDVGVKSTVGSISRSLEDKRAGFYQHAGYSLNTATTNNTNSTEVVDNNTQNNTSSVKHGNTNSNSSKIEVSRSSSKLYYKKSLKVPATSNNLIHYDLGNKEHSSNSSTTSLPWDKKFGLSSSESAVETVQVTPLNVRSNSKRSTHSHTSRLSKEGNVAQNSSQLNGNKNLVERTPNKSQETGIGHSPLQHPQTQHTHKIYDSNRRELEKKGSSQYEFFLPSTGVHSEYTADISTADATTDKELKSGEQSGVAYTGEIQESVFSVDRIVKQTMK